MIRMYISQLLTDELKVRDAYRDAWWAQEGEQRKDSCADLPSASSKRQNTHGAAKERNAFSKAEYNYPKWTAAKELGCKKAMLLLNMRINTSK